MTSKKGGGFTEETKKIVGLPSEDRVNLMKDVLTKMVEGKEELSSDVDVKGYIEMFSKFVGLNEGDDKIDWDRAENMPDNLVLEYKDLEPVKEQYMKILLEKLVIVKLNGGLGTSMGCTGPKAAILVREGESFLDLTIKQIEHLNRKYDVDVPLILMNSFNTQEETLRLCQESNAGRVNMSFFLQSRCPRLDSETLMPMAESPATGTESEKLGWYPPGHGSFFRSFHKSGLVEKLMDQGKSICFLSNIDNLGATADERILSCMANAPDINFLVEVTEKTVVDIKGGSPILYGGRPRLLEVAQVSEDHIKDFESVERFKHFNTNNLWLKLPTIQSLADADLDLIVNEKIVAGKKVIQLETAVGSAMKDVPGSACVSVPRSRFLPVKKTSDLLLVMSDLYELQEGALVVSKNRKLPGIPLIDLDKKYYKNVKDFVERFPWIPSIIALESLTVKGNVTFGKGVKLVGQVDIIGKDKENPVSVADYRVIDNATVEV